MKAPLKVSTKFNSVEAFMAQTDQIIEVIADELIKHRENYFIETGKDDGDFVDEESRALVCKNLGNLCQNILDYFGDSMGQYTISHNLTRTAAGRDIIQKNFIKVITALRDANIGLFPLDGRNRDLNAGKLYAKALEENRKYRELLAKNNEWQRNQIQQRKSNKRTYERHDLFNFEDDESPSPTKHNKVDNKFNTLDGKRGQSDVIPLELQQIADQEQNRHRSQNQLQQHIQLQQSQYGDNPQQLTSYQQQMKRQQEQQKQRRELLQKNPMQQQPPQQYNNQARVRNIEEIEGVVQPIQVEQRIIQKSWYQQSPESRSNINFDESSDQQEINQQPQVIKQEYSGQNQEQEQVQVQYRSGENYQQPQQLQVIFHQKPLQNQQGNNTFQIKEEGQEEQKKNTGNRQR